MATNEIAVKLYSVCGIHPTEGNLAYAAYQCFVSYEAANEWRVTHLNVGIPRWSMNDIVDHSAVAIPVSRGLKKGTLVYWRKLISQDLHYGHLKEYDNGTAIVLVDMKEKAVRCE